LKEIEAKSAQINAAGIDIVAISAVDVEASSTFIAANELTIPVVMLKYDFPGDNLFYSAHAIVEGIAKIPGSSTSTFRCDVDFFLISLSKMVYQEICQNNIKGRTYYQTSRTNEDATFNWDF
jgi:hypothetical protein